MTLDQKYEKLKEIIHNLGGAIVAYSGGVDSTFLLKVAYKELGSHVLGVTARSSTYPEREFQESIKYAGIIGARHKVIISEELEIEGFSKNPVNRCYYCKNELFTKIKLIAEEEGLKYVLDGSNFDDTNDYRPGMIAARENGVISPLKEAGLTKDDIRELSKREGLPTWDKPSFACLSSRFPYGNEITVEKLSMVDRAEQFLLDKGFRQVRVRHHGDIARIEVPADNRSKLFNEQLMDEIAAEFTKIGFSYITMDLKGYRTGSMNEVIDTSKAVE